MPKVNALRDTFLCHPRLCKTIDQEGILRFVYVSSQLLLRMLVRIHQRLLRTLIFLSSFMFTDPNLLSDWLCILRDLQSKSFWETKIVFEFCHQVLNKHWFILFWVHLVFSYQFIVKCLQNSHDFIVEHRIHLLLYWFVF